MNINPISFGKTIKVNAPFHEAVRIANAANGFDTVKPEIKEQVKSIIDDTKEGHAFAFSFNSCKNISYIFSGKEGREYMDYYLDHARKDISLKLQVKPIREKMREFLDEKYDFSQKVSSLISRTQENFVLKVGAKGESIEKISKVD